MKPMAKRLVIRALTVQSCLKLSDEGKHEKWGCPEKCGQHATAVPRHAEVTAGVLRGIITDLEVPAEGVAAMTTAEKAGRLTYTALCHREGSWWVITVPELESGRVTQAGSLDEVPATVADLVATMTGADPASIEVDVKAPA